MKALIVNASPRMKGNSIALSRATSSALEKAGVEVKTLFLQKMDIKPCNACDLCKKGNEVTCTFDDDMTAVYPDILNADIIVMAGPVYWFSVSAQTKLFMDRWYALEKDEGNLLKGKRMGVILTYGDDNPFESGAMNAIRTFQDAFSYTGSVLAGVVHGSCDKPGEIENNALVMAQAVELGRKLIL
jgi:multimeric flavodoxin WrbA